MTDNMGTIGPIYTRSRWFGRHLGLGIRQNQSGSRLMAGPSWPLGASYRKFCEPTDHRQRTREDGLIAAGPRSPKLGAPYTYVTTEKFLVEFGFESLRDLPDLEALKDAGLMPAAGQLCARDREPEADDAGDRLALSEVSQDSAA